MNQDLATELDSLEAAVARELEALLPERGPRPTRRGDRARDPGSEFSGSRVEIESLRRRLEKAIRHGDRLANRLEGQAEELRELSVTARRQAAELDALREKLAASDASYASLQRRFSWRITAPLRAVRSLLGLFFSRSRA